MRHIPKVTAGLKRPPEMRKKTQAVTAREKPKDLYVLVRRER
jgi:hypothetical protein